MRCQLQLGRAALCSEGSASRGTCGHQEGPGLYTWLSGSNSVLGAHTSPFQLRFEHATFPVALSLWVPSPLGASSDPFTGVT